MARDRITIEGVRQMVESVGDQNPIYTEEEFASKSRFGTIIAPPYSVLSWSVRNWEFVPDADWTGPDGHRRYRQDPNPKRLGGQRDSRSNEPFAQMRQLLNDHGYTSIAVTTGEAEFARQLTIGDQLSYSSRRVESVVGPKRTALGEGYFLTTSVDVRDQAAALVCRMRFTHLCFRPALA